MYKGMDTDVDLVYLALEQLSKIMSFENNGTTSKVVEFMRFCTGAAPDSEQSVPLSPSELESHDLFIPLAPQLEPSSSISWEPSTLPFMELTSMTSTSDPDVDVQITGFQTEVERLNLSQIILASQTEDSVPDASYLELMSTADGSIGVESQELGQEQYPWLKVTSPDQCHVAYQHFKNHIHDVIVVPYGHIQQSQEFFILAEDFALTSGNPELVKQSVYKQCFDLIEQGRNSIEFLQGLLFLVGRVVQGDIGEGLVAMEELVTRLAEFPIPEYGERFDVGLHQVCVWRHDFVSRVKQQSEIYNIFITGVSNMLFYTNTPIQRWHTILSKVGIGSRLITDMMAQYIAKNITKQELAQQFFNEENVTRREALFQGIKDMEDLMQQYEEGVCMVSDFLWQGYFNLRHGRPAIINDTSAQLLALVQKAWTVRSMAEWARNGNLGAIIRNIPEVIQQGPIKEINHNVSEPLLAMERQLKIVEASLREYQESIKIDSQFYL